MLTLARNCSPTSRGSLRRISRRASKRTAHCTRSALPPLSAAAYEPLRVWLLAESSAEAHLAQARASLPPQKPLPFERRRNFVATCDRFLVLILISGAPGARGGGVRATRSALISKTCGKPKRPP